RPLLQPSDRRLRLTAVPIWSKIELVRDRVSTPKAGQSCPAFFFVIPREDNQSMAVTAAEIKEKALEIGLTSVGVVPAERLDVAEGRLRQWLANGYHGTMAW